MNNIIELLKENKKESIQILKDKGGSIEFAVWNKDKHVYTPNNGIDYTEDIAGVIHDNCNHFCPWVTMECDYELTPFMVISATYNEHKDNIDITVTKDSYFKSDETFGIDWCADISFWSVFDMIGNMC